MGERRKLKFTQVFPLLIRTIFRTYLYSHIEIMKGVFIIKFIPAIIWLILAVVLLTLPGSTLPHKTWLNSIIYFDKIVHIGLFSMMVFLFFMPFIKSKSAPLVSQKKRILFRVALSGLALGIIIEFVQKYWIPGRGFEITDMVADGVGCFLPFVFFRLMVKSGNYKTGK